MFINTLTHKDIKKSLCEIFDMNEMHLMDSINNLKHYDDYDEQTKEICEFINNNLINKPDEILFFHLSRRLNTMIDEHDGKPLSMLLTSENDFSKFLKKYNISFGVKDNQLIFKYKNNSIDLNFNDAARIVERKILRDNCFNGQAFNIDITNSIYKYSLEECPEFINDISNLINNKTKMIEDYKKNSTYICYIYKVPINLVIVDDKNSYDEKIYSLLRRCIEILFEDGCKKDHLLLRIEDKTILPSKYFMDKYIVETDF